MHTCTWCVTWHAQGCTCQVMHQVCVMCIWCHLVHGRCVLFLLWFVEMLFRYVWEIAKEHFSQLQSVMELLGLVKWRWLLCHTLSSVIEGQIWGLVLCQKALQLGDFGQKFLFLTIRPQLQQYPRSSQCWRFFLLSFLSILYIFVYFRYDTDTALCISCYLFLFILIYWHPRRKPASLFVLMSHVMLAKYTFKIK